LPATGYTQQDLPRMPDSTPRNQPLNGISWSPAGEKPDFNWNWGTTHHSSRRMTVQLYHAPNIHSIANTRPILAVQLMVGGAGVPHIFSCSLSEWTRWESVSKN